MNIAFFVAAVLAALAIFGMKILGCFMAILVVFLGVGVETAMTVGMVLTVAMVAWIAAKSFFSGK